ncbi:cupin domain-containing protein [Aphanothece hegewaldii CCALA 016]|uniref:Cupin domain-containing protein n=1 Tax=Aphanothece hegewaldii CCALA 016 TaxID=2107694 RepID=A0A2T1LUR9_9CHRO|nr:cupin domain-containing protein [Aphanothece hegewaldii]PSF35297.1 cupin domain-containing protein [Aphanothece hegewaldii CCALA 016]
MKITTLNELPEKSVSHNPEIKKKVMLNPFEFPNITNFSQATFTPGQIAIAHAHDTMYEIFYIESGEGQIRIDGKDYPLNKGTCVVVEPGEIHEVSNLGQDNLVINVLGIVSE